MKFELHNPVRIVFGAGEVGRLGETVRAYGTRVFIATMKELEELGLLDRAIASMQAASVDFVLYPEVKPEPKSDAVDDATEIVRDAGCEVVLGVGGGSCLDFAKALAICATHPETVWDYVNLSNRPPQPVDAGKVLPIIAVPTTAGTGSEVTPYAVITNAETVQKGTIKEKAIFPKVAIVDPELTLGLPPGLTAATGIDAFAHALESYFNVPNRTPYSDRLAEEALQWVIRHLPAAYENGRDRLARSGMAWASTLAGITISLAGTTVGHALAQPLGARTGVSHANAVATFLTAVLKHTWPADSDRFVKLAQIFGVPAGLVIEEAVQQSLAWLENFLARVNLPPKLPAVREPERLREGLLEDVMTYMSRPLNQHARVFSREDLCQIVKESLDRVLPSLASTKTKVNQVGDGR